MKFDHKHRPQTLNEIIFASADVKQVLQEYGQNRREKHLLLHGPKGTGKSVAAQLVIAQRLGEVLYASWGGANNAKSYQMKHDNLDPLLMQWNWQLAMGAHTGCSVIDELDQFTLPMQHKLRAFIDQYEMGMIIATTNNLHLIDGPLKDRFRTVLVDYPTVAQWVPRVVSVLGAEGIPITAAQAQTLLTGFVGSGRSLNDWMEDYVFRLQRMMTKLTTVPTQPMSAPCATHKTAGGK